MILATVQARALLGFAGPVVAVQAGGCCSGRWLLFRPVVLNETGLPIFQGPVTVCCVRDLWPLAAFIC